MFYKLKGKKVVECSREEFVKFFRPSKNRRVAETYIFNPYGKKIWVSTVFLGLDHNFSGYGPPILFETMIFGGPYNTYQERYRTWDEAERGHARAVKKAMKSRFNPVYLFKNIFLK